MSKSKQVSDAAKEAGKRIDAALRKAEPVADSMLTRLVTSKYTFLILLAGVCAVMVAWWAW